MSIHTFDSLEDLFKKMAADREAADSKVQPWQEKVEPGQYCISVNTGFGVVIYSEVRDPIQAEIDAGADEAEVEYARKMRNEPTMKHYRFTKSYSQMCTQGEFGDIHVSTIMGFITKEAFENAKKLGWPSVWVAPDGSGEIQIRVTKP